MLKTHLIKEGSFECNIWPYVHTIVGSSEVGGGLDYLVLIIVPGDF